MGFNLATALKSGPLLIKMCIFEILIYRFIIPHVNSPYKTSIDERLIFYIIIPHINFQCKTSIGRRAVISTITLR